MDGSHPMDRVRPISWHWPALNLALHAEAETVQLFYRSRQRLFERQRGGQLFMDRSDAGDAWLLHATAPDDRDRAGRQWLRMDGPRCREEVAQANGQGQQLVGYWHTRPDRLPRPHGLDFDSLSEFGRRHRGELEHPILLIVGTGPGAGGMCAWTTAGGIYHGGLRVDY